VGKFWAYEDLTGKAVFIIYRTGIWWTQRYVESARNPADRLSRAPAQWGCRRNRRG
jgi:hypothetical protein